jgi:hypothetical protein
MFHASYLYYCIRTEHTLMIPYFVPKLLNLNITLLFYLLLFANARFCCYLVTLK